MANNSTLQSVYVITDWKHKYVYVNLVFGVKNSFNYETDARYYTTEKERQMIHEELKRIWNGRLKRTKASLEEFLD